MGLCVTPRHPMIIRQGCKALLVLNPPPPPHLKEEIDMPVFFYIDPEFATDWNCRNVNDITLSYMFHKV